MLTAVSCLFSHHFAISQADIHFQKKLTVFSSLHLKMCQNHRLRQKHNTNLNNATFQANNQLIAYLHHQKIVFPSNKSQNGIQIHKHKQTHKENHN